MSLNTFWLQERDKDDIDGNDGDDGDEHADISEDDGKTIEIKRYVGGKDGGDVDHPSDTLKHPRRPANSFLKSRSKGSFQMFDRSYIDHMIWFNRKCYQVKLVSR